MNRAKVVVKKLQLEPDGSYEYNNHLESNINNIFDAFGGKTLLKGSRDVYLKPNAIDTKPFVYTRPEFLEAVIKYFKAIGANHVYVMENATQSNYTRIVFDMVGYTKICKRNGAIPIYLDEQKTEKIEFSRKTPTINQIKPSERPTEAYDSNEFEIPRILIDKLIDHKDENLYINLPKLKTHSMGVVTLGIKNQWGFPVHVSRKFDHNYNLHSKVVDVLEYFQPDFTLIEGIEGTIHGHYPLVAFHDRVIKPFRLLIGSPNVLAADIVGSKIFGIPAEEVPSIKIAMQRGLCGGIQGLQDIEIDGDLSAYNTRYDYDIIQEFPPNVNIVKGNKLLCREGCKNNPLMVAQMLYNDYHGIGLCDLVMGKGHNLNQIDALKGPVVVAGHCAIEEVGTRLQQRLGKKHVFFSDGCNNLCDTNIGLCRYMGVSITRLVPANVFKSFYLLFQAKFHGSTSTVPSPLQILKRYKIKNRLDNH